MSVLDSCDAVLVRRLVVPVRRERSEEMAGEQDSARRLVASRNEKVSNERPATWIRAMGGTREQAV